MSTATMLLHLVVAMSVVVGVMWIAGRVLRAKGAGGTSPGRSPRGTGRPQPIDVLARRGLTKGASVAVVRAGGRTLLLGVTDAAVTLLGEAEAEPLGATAADGAGDAAAAQGSDLGGPAPLGANRSIVAALKELTVRRI